MIELHFAKIRDKLLMTIIVVGKDNVELSFRITDNEIRVEIGAGDLERYRKGREYLLLIEEKVISAWEYFKENFPKCPVWELPEREEELKKLASQTKEKLFKEIKDLIELKDETEPVFKDMVFLKGKTIQFLQN